ncbi:UNVERIFIED_CONTAM: hypothetical protein FKN15_029006 [Acipenser sinensis]
MFCLLYSCQDFQDEVIPPKVSTEQKSMAECEPGAMEGTGLSQAISIEMPEHKRLAKLFQESIQFAIQKLETSLKPTEEVDLQEFKADITNEVNLLTESLEREGAFQKCTDKPQDVPPNPEMKKAMDEVRESVERLTGECKAWDDLLHKHKSGAEEILRVPPNPEMKKAMDEVRESVERLTGECKAWDDLLHKHKSGAEEILRVPPNPEMKKAMDEVRESVERLTGECKAWDDLLHKHKSGAEEILRLTGECKAWDDLLHKHKSGAEEILRSLEQAKVSGVPLPPEQDLGLLDPSVAAVLRSKPDYQRILRGQIPVVSRLDLVVSVDIHSSV